MEQDQKRELAARAAIFRPVGCSLQDRRKALRARAMKPRAPISITTERAVPQCGLVVGRVLLDVMRGVV